MVYKQWVGKSFVDWCDEYDGDTRKVHFLIRWKANGQNKITHFTSDDYVDSLWAFRLRKGIIHSIELNKNEWWISLGLT